MNTADISSKFLNWWRQPFQAEGTVTNWFLFTGLVLVLIWLWSRILKEAGHVIGA